MAFGKVSRHFFSYLFLTWSSSFEGLPLSLLACFFQAVYLTDLFRELKNWLIPGLAGMLPCVEVDKGIICGDFGKFE